MLKKLKSNSIKISPGKTSVERFVRLATPRRKPGVGLVRWPYLQSKRANAGAAFHRIPHTQMFQRRNGLSGEARHRFCAVIAARASVRWSRVNSKPSSPCLCKRVRSICASPRAASLDEKYLLLAVRPQVNLPKHLVGAIPTFSGRGQSFKSLIGRRKRGEMSS